MTTLAPVVRRFRPLLLTMICGLATVSSASAQILEGDDDTLTASPIGLGRSRVNNLIQSPIQRGTRLDGGIVRSGTAPLGLAANPASSSWNGNGFLGDVDLSSGFYSPSDVDMSLPAPGFSWTVGRSFTSKNDHATPDSDGPQGINWMQSSQVEIVYIPDTTPDPTKDVVRLIYGAAAFVDFVRGSSTNNEFKGVNGATGVFKYVSGSPDTWTLTDPSGMQAVFFGGNTGSNQANWQVWKYVDPAGNTAYVGHASTAATAVSNGYDASGRILYAYDTADRRYTYTYSTIDSVVRLTQVKAETRTGGTWASSPTGVVTVGQVDYAYYQTGSNTYGDNGALRQVTITTPLSDPTQLLVRKKLYHYYKGAYNGSTNPGESTLIKLVAGFEGVRKYDWATGGNLNDDQLTATTTALEPYSEAVLEYDSSRRVYKVFSNGDCGCSGGPNGTYELSYGNNGSFSNTSGYDTAWKSRTIVKRPDTTYFTQYFDEVGQPLSRIVTNTDPGSSPTQTWTTAVTRGSGGAITAIGTPANVTGYTHTTGAITSSSSVGLLQNTSLISSGALTNFADASKFKDAGTGASANFVTEESITTRDFLVTSGGAVKVQRPQHDWRRAFHTADTVNTDASKYDQTDFTYTYWSSTSTSPLYIAPKTIVTTMPIVTTGTNGSNSVTTATTYLRMDGTVAFTKTPDGIYSYGQYTNGQLTKSIQDAQTDHGSDFAGGDDPSTDFSISETSDGTRLITTYTFDAQGRLNETTSPDNSISKMWYTKLSDGRMVTLSIPLVVPGTPTYYGPVGYTVTNQAGKAEFSGTIALGGGSSTTALTSWITSSADPIAALAVGTVARMQTQLYTSDGTRVTESRAYFLIPGSGAGSAGTNYDSTTYGYDDAGRQRRVKDPTGTITRSVYDAAGRMTESWLGTNDYSFAGGEVSGPDNMVKVAATEFDGGGIGNSLVTKTTAFVEGSTTDRRDTSYLYDARGRRIVTMAAQSPHSVAKYDNLNRPVASGQYSSSSGLSATTDPTSAATNRIALSESAYDSNGRIWQTTRHKITQSSGATADTLLNQQWFDSAGRKIKSKGPGGIVKSVYDRLGRTVRRFSLSSDDDSAYADVADVIGDAVLTESQTLYENTTSLPLMQVSIARYHDDTSGTDELDSNNDGNYATVTAADVAGRLSISVNYYDTLHRVVDTVQYGNAGISNGSGSAFTRPGSAASRSDTALRTTNTYNTDGTLQQVTDPKALITRFGYDGAGRKTSVIANYTDGTPGGGTNNDQDQVTRYEFTSGLQTKTTADLTSNDQETIYTYGVAKGASLPDSKISSNRLLHTVQYPDSSGGSDVMTYAYNAQGQQIYVKDQLGTETALTYDTAGRLLHRGLTTIAGSLDSSVARISTAYDSRSMMSTVTQYDNATPGSGSVIDQVKYTYDDWGNTTLFEQDRDSTVGGGGNQYSVAYAYAKNAPTSGSTMLRRSTMTLPDGSTLTYGYGAANSIADDQSRVSTLTLGAVPVASYSYLGDAQLVGTNLPEPNVSYNLYGPSSARDYARLDRFGRTVSSRWDNTGGSDTPFYQVDLAYDRNSNITQAEDTIQHNGGANETFSAQYSMDDLNRLIRAEEGNWSGSAITNRTRDELWTLSQTGNFDRRKIDLDGNGNFTGTDEIDDTGTFNKANEWLTRDTDSNASVNFTLTHDAAGQLTDDGKSYKYKYDGFGRLKEVKNQSNALVAEYRYNGLGYRIGWHYDTDLDTDVDGSDLWIYFAYDERWRPVATFRSSDSAPKEQFVFHAAGKSGRGGSSYIDSVVLRDKDVNTAWTTASDTVLEDRIYYGQNWRSDVSVIVKPDSGSGLEIIEWVKYSAYGVPFCISAGDYDRSGTITTADDTAFDTDWNNTHARADINFDGSVDLNDFFAFYNAYGTGEGGGRDVASRSSVKNRTTYAGFQWDQSVQNYHARHRVLISELGRWARRDPLEEGLSLYAYCRASPVVHLDSSGLWTMPTIHGTFFNFDLDSDPRTRIAAISEVVLGVGNAKNDCGAEGGYIVQRVQVSGRLEFNISSQMHAEYDYSVKFGTFWEAMEFPRSAHEYDIPAYSPGPQDPISPMIELPSEMSHMHLGGPNPRRPYGRIDKFTVVVDQQTRYDPPYNTGAFKGYLVGYMLTTGHARVYCKRDVVGDDPAGWGRLPFTGHFPSKRERPSFWELPDQVGVYHEFGLSVNLAADRATIWADPAPPHQGYDYRIVHTKIP